MKLKVKRYGDDWYAVPEISEEYDATIDIDASVGETLIGVAYAYELASACIKGYVEHGID